MPLDKTLLFLVTYMGTVDYDSLDTLLYLQPLKPCIISAIIGARCVFAYTRRHPSYNPCACERIPLCQSVRAPYSYNKLREDCIPGGLPHLSVRTFAQLMLSEQDLHRLCGLMSRLALPQQMQYNESGYK